MTDSFRELLRANPPACDNCGKPTRPYEASPNDPRWPDWQRRQTEAKRYGLQYFGMSKCTACGDVHLRFINPSATA